MRHLKPYMVILSIALVAIIYYFFSFIIPFTNNAFVVANVRPVASLVSGYVTNLYIKNEQYVKKGTPLFTVFKEPYQLTYHKLQEQVKTAEADFQSLQHQLQKDQQLLIQYNQGYNKVHLNYVRNKSVLKIGAVSEIDVKNLQFEDASLKAKVDMQKQQIQLDEQNLVSIQHKIKALNYELKNVKVSLDQTTVYAQDDGQIQNMYLSVGTPVEVNKPIFSFVDTRNLYIQANMSEIDLRLVRAGNKVYILPRMYFGTKVYRGTVISRAWATNRQITNEKTQLQTVTNNSNNWVLLPQRFPVQIKILNYDHKDYPLPIGASCYVIIMV